MEHRVTEGDNPVRAPPVCRVRYVFDESGCLGIQSKTGGKFHLKLNTGNRPIANKYREGKMKRTLKRELKGLEIAKREPLGRSVAAVDIAWRARARRVPSAACWSASAGRPGSRLAGRWAGPALRCGCPAVTARRLPCRASDRGSLKPRPVPGSCEETGRPPRDDSVLVPRGAVCPGMSPRKRGKDADEMYPIDPS